MKDKKRSIKEIFFLKLLVINEVLTKKGYNRVMKISSIAIDPLLVGVGLISLVGAGCLVGGFCGHVWRLIPSGGGCLSLAFGLLIGKTIRECQKWRHDQSSSLSRSAVPTEPPAETHPISNVTAKVDTIYTASFMKKGDGNRQKVGKPEELGPVKKILMSFDEDSQKRLVDLFNANSVWWYEKKNVTHRYLMVPGIPQMQEKATQLCTKYGISIAFADLSKWEQEMATIHTNHNDSYVGVIAYDNDGLHVTPVLCYFGKNPQHDEYIFLDSVELHQDLLRLLQKKNKTVYYTSFTRQADPLSCRTEALIILRNALLDLKAGAHSNGFKSILENAILDEKNIKRLPATWDYTAQIAHGHDSETAPFMPRSLFSKKKDKQPKTTIAHRSEYTEEVDFECQIWLNEGGFQEKVSAITCPKGVTLTSTEHMTTMNFTVKQSINTYLAKKGHKEAALAAKAVKDEGEID